MAPLGTMLWFHSVKLAQRYALASEKEPRLDFNKGARDKKVQLKVRLSDRLRYQLERSAERAGHSMNQEIVSRLFRSFRSNDNSSLLLARAIFDQHPDVAHRVAHLVRHDGKLPGDAEEEP